jgi:hypothetical protein
MKGRDLTASPYTVPVSESTGCLYQEKFLSFEAVELEYIANVWFPS